MARSTKGGKVTPKLPALRSKRDRTATAASGGRQPSTKRPRLLKATAANDFEVEEVEPEEVRHKNKYDKVESYEYEMPADFDDEEIDEDTAFNDEDNKRYADFFSEGGPDDDEDEAVSAEEDNSVGGSEDDEDVAALLDSDEVEPEGAQINDDGKLEGDGDGDAGLFNDEEEGGEEEEDEEEDLDHEDAAARHRDMVAAALGRRPSEAAGPGADVVSEAYPESEFSLNPAAASGGPVGQLSINDLLQGLGSRRRQLGSASKALERLAGTSGAGGVRPLSGPLPRPVRERKERTAGYVQTAEDITRWQPIVKANREAPTLRFTSARGDVHVPTTTAMLTASFEPENEMEAEVAAMLEAAGANSMRAIQEAEDSLTTKALTMEEAKARRERLAQMRSLLFYHELKAKRLKHIKSKEFHRKQSKSARRRAAKLGLSDEGGDAAAAALREAAEAQEYERAKERLTLKHKNTSRWARRALKRGLSALEPGTKAALDEQLSLGQALRRKMQGEAHSSDASTSASDSEKEGGKEGVSGLPGLASNRRAKAAALDILSGGPDAGMPTRGLMALPFMARAAERKRAQAQQEARELLEELQEQEAQAGGPHGDLGDGTFGGATTAEAGVAKAGRATFGGAAAGQADGPTRNGSNNATMVSDGDDDDPTLLQGTDRTILGADDSEDDDAGCRPSASVAQAVPGRRRRATQAEEADLDIALMGGRGTLVSGEGAGVCLDMLQLRSKQAAGAPARCADGGGVPRGHLFDPTAAGLSSRQPQQPPKGSGGCADTPAFMPSSRFQGAKPGYVFMSGGRGVGYYIDSKAPGSAAIAAAGRAGPGPGSEALAAEAMANGAKPLTGRAARRAAARMAHELKSSGEAPAAEAPPISKAPAVSAAAADGDNSSEDDDAKLRVAAQTAAGRQAELVRLAFAGDDVEADFEAEKAQDVGGELPRVEEASALPGWGHWRDDAKDKKRLLEGQAKADRLRAAAAKQRRDAELKHVVLSEKWDKKAATYHATTVPYPFDSKESYERFLRQPLGPDFNPDRAHRNLTRPAVLKSTGVVIQPIRYAKPLDARDQQKQRQQAAVASGATPRKDGTSKAARVRRDVVTIAGGTQLDKRQ